MATTAGLTTDSIARWPLFLPVLLLCSAFIGGCTGSTGGGLKVIRILLLFKQGNRELKRLVHPNAVYRIKLGNRAMPERILEAVWGIFSAYALVLISVSKVRVPRPPPVLPWGTYSTLTFWKLKANSSVSTDESAPAPPLT